VLIASPQNELDTLIKDSVNETAGRTTFRTAGSSSN